ncbi:hypothetical protein CTAYLR_003108 [Chrysophaeum taylorii]|uniref:DUF4116 domain-containing protein n=1 Tax=Chrysophaeum taylorii TaxID=2483200 RepID=A0AAD7U6J2_9STRA|nr:hypothetical protein CTAYLR_003108 [Chrysophaeum taylorii]
MSLWEPRFSLLADSCLGKRILRCARALADTRVCVAWMQTLGDTRLVRWIFALLCLLPIADIVSDIHQTVFFAVEGWAGSFSLALIVVYCSWRFGTLYAGCHPKPTCCRVLVLYVPGLVIPFWSVIARNETEAQDAELPADTEHDATDSSDHASIDARPQVDPGEENEESPPGDGGETTSSDDETVGQGAPGDDTVETGLSADQNDEGPKGDNNNPTRTLFNLENDQLYVLGVIEDAGREYQLLSSCCERFVLILYFEAKVLCLILIYYVRFLWNASLTLAREALMRADDRPEDARQHEIYSLVLACLEGLFESTPQLMLQISTYRWAIKKNLDEPFMGVSYTTWFAVSAFFSCVGILKAAILFGCNFNEILNVLAPSVERARFARARRDRILNDETPDILKRDKQFVLAVVRKRGWALRYADPELKKDKEFVLAAVRESGYALDGAALELRIDKEFVLAAVRESGTALNGAAPELKKDKEVVLAAVRQHGYVLRYAAPELKKDKEVVLAAVRENGYALEYAAPELKKDKEFVLAVVREHGYVLRYADPELKKDKEVVLAAVRGYRYALRYAAPELKKDKEVRRAARGY